MKQIAERKGKKITFLDKDIPNKNYVSISYAKKQSHILQMQNGGLGRGSLKVWCDNE